METLTEKELRKKFKEMYKEEFGDPNESFMDYMLDLIPKEVLEKLFKKWSRNFYSLFDKYK